MNNHPLEFFKELAENSQTIGKTKAKFYSSYSEEMVLELDREREFIKIINPFDSESDSIIRYFHGYLKEVCNERMHHCLKQIEVDVLSAGDSAKEKNYLQRIVTEIDLLVSKKNNRNDLDKYPFIVTTLESTKEYVQSHYGLAKKDSSVTSLQSPSKIKWRGKINVLTTLFYDLIHGKESKDESKKIAPLIDASPKEIEDFILNNFLDENGEPFSQKTINTNLKPSKQSEKRAKGDIVIELSRA